MLGPVGEPHAYISPQLYESPINVPTWNYIAVHAYGKAQLIADEIAATALLEQTINYYEAQYMVQWNSLPQDYKDRLLKGIVAFEIVVTELQGKQKLSQNKKRYRPPTQPTASHKAHIATNRI
ncbi:MAG: FMN-binding negative transcriptional regulator [Sphingobacteriales bacterium]|nr:FMN-binding negative transcriptional regulator [Sphingobacteriales bacterium]